MAAFSSLAAFDFLMYLLADFPASVGGETAPLLNANGVPSPLKPDLTVVNLFIDTGLLWRLAILLSRSFSLSLIFD